MHKGVLITFEGGEGAGKSTLMQKVYDFLRERYENVVKTRAPGGTKVGEQIRELLLHKDELALYNRAELLLFLADRAQHVHEVLRPALERNCIILCDRFHDSTLAYQGVARGFGEEVVKDLCLFAAENLQSDLTIYLDIDPKIGLERIKANRPLQDRMEAEHIEFHQKLRNGYQKIAKEEPERFKTIDAKAPVEVVFQQAMKYIDAVL